MRLVVDANILISALIADSKTRELIIDLDHEFYSPDFLKTEIRKHKNELLEKSGLKESDFRSLMILLLERINVVPIEEYEEKLARSKEVMRKIDLKDAPFLACALAKNAKIWSDDGHFQKQNLVPALETHELVRRMQSK